MTKTSSKIVFFGSGPVAAKSLGLLLKHRAVEAVITKKSTEREMKAVAKDTPLFFTKNKAELDALIAEKQFSSRLGILIDFGIIVSQKVIDSFELGIINSHFSLLPELRGADPITFSILSGQEQTGVSLMLLVEAMDEGPLLEVGIEKLDGNVTGPGLTNKLINLSDALLQHALPRYFSGEAKGVAQEKMTDLIPNYPATPTYSRKLTKSDGVLDFSKSAEQLEREVRAFLDWPKSRTEIAGKDVVVLKATVDMSSTGKPGEVFKTSDRKIGLYAQQGALIIEELKPAGKQAMTSEGFLAGYGKDIALRAD